MASLLTEPFSVSALNNNVVKIVPVSGTIESLTSDANNVLYVGGSVSGIYSTGTTVAYTFPVNIFTGQIEEDAPNNLLSVAAFSSGISDGNGGWYLAGSPIESIGATYINGSIIHINSDYSIDTNFSSPYLEDSENPGAGNTSVSAMALSSTTLYVAGSFDTAASSSRHLLAAFNRSTGALLSWQADVSSTDSSITPSVIALAFSSGTLYVGGAFDILAGGTREYLGAVDASTGVLLDWNPGMTGFTTYVSGVNALAIASSSIFVGGSFTSAQTSIGGASRRYLAQLLLSTASSTNWRPDPNNYVQSLVLASSSLYVGGNFTSIGGRTKQRLAQLNLTTGSSTASFTANKSSVVNAIAISSTTVYAGFTGSPYFSANNAYTGAARYLGFVAEASPNAMVLSDNKLFIIGSYLSPTAASRNKAFSLGSDYSLSSWNPLSLDNSIYSIYASSSAVYIGGDFTGKLKALDKTTGADLSWNPNPNNNIRAIEVTSGSVWVAGFFSNIGGLNRRAVAELDITTGSSTSWNAGASNAGVSYDLVLTTSSVFVGATQINFAPFDRIGVVELTRNNATTTSFNPRYEDGGALAIQITTTTVYAGGSFGLREIDRGTSSSTGWLPQANSTVYSLFLASSSLFVGGSFNSIGGQVRRGLAQLDLLTANATGWNPNLISASFTPDRIIYREASSTLIAGGSFTPQGGNAYYGLAIFGPAIQFTATSSIAAESSGSHTVGASLNEPLLYDVSASYSVFDGTAIGSGTDYTLANGTVFFPAGTTATSVNITVVDDAYAEGTENIVLVLNDPRGAFLGDNNYHVYNISDSLDGEIGAVTLSTSTASLTEGASSTYTFVLNTPPYATATITLSPDAQLSISSTTLLFTAIDWNVSQSVTVTATDDSSVEGTHSGTITHSVMSDDPAYNNLSISNLTVTITDNDTAPEEETPETAVSGGALPVYLLNALPAVSVFATTTPSGPKPPFFASSTVFASVSPFVFPLRYGMRSERVKELQIILSEIEKVYPEKLKTGYFGPLTLAAVRRFQEFFGIATSGNPGYGYVGPLTRERLNKLIGEKPAQ